MLSAGERPQPPHASIVDSTVSKARIMPDLTNGTNGVTSSKPAQMQHIWVVTGPAGCGKSTVGNVLRTELGVPFLEGDDVSIPLYTTYITLHTFQPSNCTQTQQHPDTCPQNIHK